MSEWISVEDKLPDKPGVYKVKGRRGSIGAHSVVERTHFNGQSWASFFDWDKVTHWMPLPEPPEAE